MFPQYLCLVSGHSLAGFFAQALTSLQLGFAWAVFFHELEFLLEEDKLVGRIDLCRTESSIFSVSSPERLLTIPCNNDHFTAPLKIWQPASSRPGGESCSSLRWSLT